MGKGVDINLFTPFFIFINMKNIIRKILKEELGPWQDSNYGYEFGEERGELIEPKGEDGKQLVRAVDLALKNNYARLFGTYIPQHRVFDDEDDNLSYTARIWDVKNSNNYVEVTHESVFIGDITIKISSHVLDEDIETTFDFEEFSDSLDYIEDTLHNLKHDM